MGSFLSLCLTALCAVGQPSDVKSVATFQDFYKKDGYTERLVVTEHHGLLEGFIEGKEGKAAVGGVLPLRLGTKRFAARAGFAYATRELPTDGTHWNFVVVGYVGLTDHLGFAYLHVSNSRKRPYKNPSLDALGVVVKFSK